MMKCFCKLMVWSLKCIRSGKSLEQTASVIALRVSFHRGAALWISVTAVTDICGSDGPGHSKPRREQRQYAIPVKKVKGNEICTQSKTKKMSNWPCEADTVHKQKGAGVEDRRWFVLNALL